MVRVGGPTALAIALLGMGCAFCITAMPANASGPGETSVGRSAGPSGVVPTGVRTEPSTPPDLPALCERAADRAAIAFGIPPEVLRALTLTETGRRIGEVRRPWPWATNTEGRSGWHETREAALGHARSAIAQGKTSIDLGCFQINYRWHGQAFDDLSQMLDPDRNAHYAAGFVAGLHEELGDWGRAAGAFHSRTEVHAAAYRARFAEQLAALQTTSGPAAHPPHVRPSGVVTGERRNGYPLLLANTPGGSGGSLFPARAAAGQTLLRRPSRALLGGG